MKNPRESQTYKPSADNQKQMLQTNGDATYNLQSNIEVRPQTDTELNSKQLQMQSACNTLHAKNHSSLVMKSRRHRFTKEEDIVILREVAAAKAHVAPNGEPRERFEIVAAKVNSTKKLKNAVSWESVQDRYKRFQERFDTMEKAEAAMSEVGGEMGEFEELLSVMKEARDDLQKEKAEKREKMEEQDRRKERLGAFIRERATKRKETVGRNGDDSDDRDERANRRGKRSATSTFSMEEETQVFTKALEIGENRRMELEEERLKLDRDRFESEKKERELDREERRRERAESQRIELEKFRMMMDVMRGFKSSAGFDNCRKKAPGGDEDDPGFALLRPARRFAPRKAYTRCGL